MTLSKKFNIYLLVIAISFIAILFVSKNTITTLSEGNQKVQGSLYEINYMNMLNNGLHSLDRNIEHYLGVMSGVGHGEEIIKDLENIEELLIHSDNLDFGTDMKKTILYFKNSYKDLSNVIRENVLDEEISVDKRKAIYHSIEEKYIEKISLSNNNHIKNSLELIKRVQKNSQLARERAFWMLLWIAFIMIVILIGSRLFLDKSILRPLKLIEDTSISIASGETGKRLDILSGDELGSLCRSINLMAEAIENKMEMLRCSIAREQAIVREQAILNELMGFIASGMNIDLVLRTFISRTRDLMKSEHSSLFIFDDIDSSDIEPKIFYSTLGDDATPDCAKALLDGILKDVLRTFTPLRINEIVEQPLSIPIKISNILAIPLSSAERSLYGIITVSNKVGGFDQDDEDTLFNFSFQAFQAITMQQEIVRYATIDGLTGLNNRRVFMERLNEEMERSKRYSHDLALLMIDIDHFKNFNDTYGHQAGDIVLKGVAELLHKNIRSTDIAARYGGEEFAVILPETTVSQAKIVAERVRSNINKYEFLLPENNTVQVTVSIGYAGVPADAEEPSSLINIADKGLYLAKEMGRNRVCYWKDSNI